MGFALQLASSGLQAGRPWAPSSPPRSQPRFCCRPVGLRQRGSRVPAPRCRAVAGKELTQAPGVLMPPVGPVEELPLPDGDLGWPIVGETFRFMGDYYEFYRERFAKHGNVFKTHILGNPTVVVCTESEVRRILQGEAKGMVVSNWPQSMQDLLGPGSMLNVSGKEHTRQRRILMQAFTEAAIKEYVPTMLDITREEVAAWAAANSVEGWVQGHVYAFHIAAAVLLGGEWDAPKLNEMRALFETFLHGLYSPPINFPGTLYFKSMQARTKIVEEVEKNIVKAREEGPATNGARKTALQMMVNARDEDGSQAGIPELRDQALTQLFAGQETTARTIVRLFELVNKHPHVMQRLRQEQAELQQHHGADITGDVLERMPYADAVIKELLRLHPVADGVWRKTLVPLAVNGKQVPAGWTINLRLEEMITGLPDFQDVGSQFSPEQWEVANSNQLRKDPKGYIPFGEGPRRCLGMHLAIAELRILLAVLAREYSWELLRPEEVWAYVDDNFRPQFGQPLKFMKLS